MIEYFVAVGLVLGVSQLVSTYIQSLVKQFIEIATTIFIVFSLLTITTFTCILIYGDILSSWWLLTLVSGFFGVIGGITGAVLRPLSQVLSDLSPRPPRQEIFEAAVPEVPAITVKEESIDTTTLNLFRKMLEEQKQEQVEALDFFSENEALLKEMLTWYRQQRQRSLPEAAVSADRRTEPPQMLKVECPSCGKTYRNISVKFRGRTTPCKKCGHTLTI